MDGPDHIIDLIAVTGSRIFFEVVFQKLVCVGTSLLVGGVDQHIVGLLNQVCVGGVLLISLQLVDATGIIF